MTPRKYGKERVITKETGVLVVMLVKMKHETYSNHVMFETGKKVIYIVVLIEIYEIFVSTLLLCDNCFGDLEILDFCSFLTIHVLLTG